MLERGDINQSSWAFTVAEQKWDVDGEKPIRTITRVGNIYDVSLVTYPANPDTSVALRSMPEANHHEADVQPEQQLEVQPIKKETMENNPEAQELRTDKFVDSSAIQRGFSASSVKDLAKFNPVKVVRELAEFGRLTGINQKIHDIMDLLVKGFWTQRTLAL